MVFATPRVHRSAFEPETTEEPTKRFRNTDFRRSGSDEGTQKSIDILPVPALPLPYAKENITLSTNVSYVKVGCVLLQE